MLSGPPLLPSLQVTALVCVGFRRSLEPMIARSSPRILPDEDRLALLQAMGAYGSVVSHSVPGLLDELAVVGRAKGSVSWESRRLVRFQGAIC